MANDSEGTTIRGDRFSGGPARAFLSSMTPPPGATPPDKRLFEADLLVDRAHVVMLAEEGVIEPETASAILAALSEIEADGYDALESAEDIHEAIEGAVIEHAGPDGGRMHTARSRNDEVATCLRIRMRSDLLAIAKGMIALEKALLDIAATETETLLPGMTHLQFAQPITVAHFACSYAAALSRDLERILDAFERTNRNPLGSAALAGTPFSIDRDRTTELLGFDGVLENAMDAVSSRDFLLESTSAMASIGLTLSGLATDGIEYSSRGWLELDDDYASTSSIMPQKKNPDTLELVRASAGDVIGAEAGLQQVLKGLPRAYNRDLQRASTHPWRAVDAILDAIEVTTGALATATWNVEALDRAAGEGFSTATGVADALAMAGIPFRDAHAIVAEVATTIEEDPRSDPSAVIEAIEAAAGERVDEATWNAVDVEAIAAALDPQTSVNNRNSRGGPGPDAIAEQHHRLSTRLQAQEVRLEQYQSSLEDARDDLNAAVEPYR